MNKQTVTILFLLVIFINLQCTNVAAPSNEGKITVYVYWQEGLPNKKVEILQTGDIRYTNEDGIAEFFLQPGEYTVRAYDITIDPYILNVDNTVALQPSATKFVFVFDCLGCF